MLFNDSKCTHTSYSSSKQPSKQSSKTNENEIDICHSIKDLRITISENLTFSNKKLISLNMIGHKGTWKCTKIIHETYNRMTDLSYPERLNIVVLIVDVQCLVL